MSRTRGARCAAALVVAVLGGASFARPAAAQGSAPALLAFVSNEASHSVSVVDLGARGCHWHGHVQGRG